LQNFTEDPYLKLLGEFGNIQLLDLLFSTNLFLFRALFSTDRFLFRALFSTDRFLFRIFSCNFVYLRTKAKKRGGKDSTISFVFLREFISFTNFHTKIILFCEITSYEHNSFKIRQSTIDSFSL